MDKSIEKINDYRRNTAIVNEPVVLKRLKNPKLIITYLVLPCNLPDISYILTYQTLPYQILDYMIEKNYLNKEEDIEQVLHCGILHEFNGYRDLIYKFPQRKIDIRNRVEPIYRFYEYSLERQKQHINVHNMAPTPEHSWNSVIRKVGSDYGLVLKIKTLNNGNTL